MKIFNWIARKFNDWTKKKEKPLPPIELSDQAKRESGMQISINIPEIPQHRREFFYKALKEALKEGVLQLEADKILRTEINRYFNSEAYLRARYGVEVKKVRKARKRKTRKKTRQK